MSRQPYLDDQILTSFEVFVKLFPKHSNSLGIYPGYGKISTPGTLYHVQSATGVFKVGVKSVDKIGLSLVKHLLVPNGASGSTVLVPICPKFKDFELSEFSDVARDAIRAIGPTVDNNHGRVNVGKDINKAADRCFVFPVTVATDKHTHTGV